jgi:hypothetical protein
VGLGGPGGVFSEFSVSCENSFLRLGRKSKAATRLAIGVPSLARKTSQKLKKDLAFFQGLAIFLPSAGDEALPQTAQNNEQTNKRQARARRSANRP